ncbi:MAG: NAD(P)H-dependent oxidoreductase [Luteolibacter sp.]|uniref:NAD(P)H-dependent oxidoreductase n=1 Tax=Luteolibacter sp. TaxID=1962973 RepID=UPI0032660C1C
MTLSTDKLLASLRWRYATKKFDPARRISEKTWEAIEESLVLTPSSFGLQPWKFIVVNDPGVRANLSGESWRQPQVTAASHYVVLTARTDLNSTDIDAWMERMVETQGSSHEAVAPYKGVIEGFALAMSHEARHAWNVRQVYIALGQLMATAAMLGIDACPMEGLSAVGYDHILGLEGSGYATVVACALGYRAEDDKVAAMPKARFDRSRVISHI